MNAALEIIAKLLKLRVSVQLGDVIPMARVLISMDDGFLELVDDLANKEHRSRSELIREALRNYMRRGPGMMGLARAEEDAKALEMILED